VASALTLDVYSHIVPALESDAAARVDFTLRKAFGQQPDALALPAKTKDAAIAYGVKVSAGGRSRTRTSDLILIRDAL
jgi:hypothetical protein